MRTGGTFRFNSADKGNGPAPPRRGAIRFSASFSGATMRLIITLLAFVGGFILVGMTVAPSQPALRDWYVGTACPYLDKISLDICAAVRRSAEGRAF